ncbi:magnesium chelatase domain-containing protein [Cytobacillus firmus]|uniref:magnesium chelatase domain-containing protein n=1 Tax=Cytobacillus firmus TaxID=1399 RepID=UPI0018CCF797|nr:magnesium chelatase domain-containing protein [Cytobacillus firmus]MBG9444261.1 hypothetical protein [Cytobacillus firmus]
MQKIIIHLSPAELKKNGQPFDLAMAISILVSLKELKPIIPLHFNGQEIIPLFQRAIVIENQ